MTLAFETSHVTVYQGDALTVLQGLADASVDCCVTSPPYWGLRDYGVAGQLGLEPTPALYVERMAEVFREVRRVLSDRGTVFLNLGDSYASALVGGTSRTAPQGSPDDDRPSDGLCGACADVLSPRTARNDDQPAHAPSASEHGTTQARMESESGRPASSDSSRLDSPRSVAKTRSSYRRDRAAVQPLSSRESMPPRSAAPLRDDCSHCANCGVCLRVAGSATRDARMCGRKAGYTNGTVPLGSDGHNRGMDAGAMAYSATAYLKPKDMVGIPWRVALALQADGWYLRSDIIWAKPNPMPESVTDRPTKAHEYVFLLSKSERYFFDQEAVREPAEYGRREHSYNVFAEVGDAQNSPLRMKGTVSGGDPSAGRNIRSVWTIATQPYPEAHFATFPRELPERCIKAGCPEQVCATCGKARERITERTENEDTSAKGSTFDGGKTGARDGGDRTQSGPRTLKASTGWTDCGHNAYIPGTVLDPFAGSGTTLAVARDLGRKSIGIELSPEYVKLIEKRCAQQALEMLA